MYNDRALIALNIESYNLLSADCIEEIRRAKTIAIITENYDDEIMLTKNIIHLLNHKMHMNIIMLQRLKINGMQYENDNLIIVDTVDSAYNKFSDANNTAIIVGNSLTVNEQNKLHSKFDKIIYQYALYNDIFNTDIIFCYHSNENPYYHCFPSTDKTRISYNELETAIRTCTNNTDVVLISNNSIKICKIEHPNTFIECYYQYVGNKILQAIKKISNNESIFYSKNDALYDLLWKKYYFITKCVDIWLTITYFAKYSEDILGIIIHFMVMIFMNDINIHPRIWQPKKIIYHMDTYRYST